MKPVTIISGVTGILALAGLLSAVMSEMWLRHRRGQGETAARLLTIMKDRVSDFRRFQIFPFLTMVAVAGLALGIATSWKHTAVYVVGAVICFGAALLIPGTFVSGTLAAYDLALSDDLKTSSRASFRSGAVMGLVLMALAVIIPAVLMPFFRIRSVIRAAACLGLAASSAAVIINNGGTVYTSAYDLALKENDFTDRTGSFAAAFSDIMESVMLSLAAAIMLAEVGVDTSGVDSTFNLSDSASFPLIISAAGIIASLAGIMTYRGYSFRRPAGGCLASMIVAGVLSAGAAVFASISLLQSPVYAFAVICGIAAGLILCSFAMIFSPDGKVMMGGYKADRRLNHHAPMMFNLSSGMSGTAVNIIVIAAAVIVSFNLAGLYGVALCAAGLNSISACAGAAAGLSTVSSAARGVTQSSICESRNDQTTDILDTISVRTGMWSKSFRSSSFILTLIAVLAAVTYNADTGSLDLFDPVVLMSLLCGIGLSFVLAGMISGSVRLTSRVLTANLYGDIEEYGQTGSLRGTLVPVIMVIAVTSATGLLFGVESLTGLLTGTAMSGYLIMLSADYSGQYYENSAVQSLGSLVKFMAIFAAAFLPALLRVGGFIY